MGTSISCEGDRPSHVAYDKSKAQEAVVPLHDGEVVKGEWLEATDPKTNLTYYYHSVTKETRWEHPDQQAEREALEAKEAAEAPAKVIHHANLTEEDDPFAKDEDAITSYYKKHFDYYDADKNGVLDHRELQKLLKDLYVPTKREMNSFVRHFDKNSDGRIEWKEFRTGLQRLNPKYRLKEYEPFLHALFDKFDTNGDQYLTGEELEDVARHVLSVPPSITIDVLREFDENGDELVSFDEFVAAIERLRGDLQNVWTENRQRSVNNNVESGLANVL